MRIAGILFVLASCSCASPGRPSLPRQASPPVLEGTALPEPTSGSASSAFRDPDRLDRDLLRRVDEAIQGRFALVRSEDLRKGRLGASRVGRPSPPRHFRVFEPEADSEREMLAGLRAAGWLGVVYVVGESRFVGPITLGREEPSRVGDRKVVRALAAACLASGRSAQGSDGPVVFEARSVLASQALCLRCHAEKSLGDPIGVVVYAFSKGNPWVATGSGK